MYRLFAAIDPPSDVKQRLLSLCCGVPGAKWVDEDRMHLTLRFVGEVDGAVFRDVRDALAVIKAEPFELTLSGVGFFPPRKAPEILWVGVEKNELLLRLRNRIETAVKSAGVPADKRKFAPHVQLARLSKTPDGRVARFLAMNSLLRLEPFEVDQFYLYSSFLSSERALHRIEAEYPLTSKQRTTH